LTETQINPVRATFRGSVSSSAALDVRGLVGRIDRSIVSIQLQDLVMPSGPSEVLRLEVTLELDGDAAASEALDWLQAVASGDRHAEDLSITIGNLSGGLGAWYDFRQCVPLRWIGPAPATLVVECTPERIQPLQRDFQSWVEDSMRGATLSRTVVASYHSGSLELVGAVLSRYVFPVLVAPPAGSKIPVTVEESYELQPASVAITGVLDQPPSR
jgi:hypothetical protein